MDEFAEKLKRDARQIEGGVPDALRARIDERVRATRRAAPPRDVARGLPLFTWSSAAAGVAALAGVLLFLNRPTVEPLAPLAATPPPTVGPRFGEPLAIETVALTEPLQLELERLRADLEMVRESIERDLRSSL